ncbi:MAG: FdhF/YdeP family oxidoreductase [Vicinamibacterales bacterium]
MPRTPRAGRTRPVLPRSRYMPLLPTRWASWSPGGLGYQKPRHYLEMLKIAWRNRDELPFAWRILRDGVCDGCALGASGLRDWTIRGTHLCMVRLDLLRYNTAPALDVARLADVEALRELSSKELRDLGRLPTPLVRRRGDAGFTPLAWNDALSLAADGLRACAPERSAFYLTSRGITNEVYYAAQKAARFFGTNNVDNASRLCHAASGVAMKAMLGEGAATCSYADWLDADLIVFFGANAPNNQPVTTKYLLHAKRRGAQVAVVNPFREPGLERYWVPSALESALFGTRLTDHWFDVNIGGDLAFLIGVLRALVEDDGVDRAFIDAHTEGFESVRESVLATPWTVIESESGTTRDRLEAFARLLVDRPNAVLVWSMGITQHTRGVETVKALVNLALARGLLGQPRRGLMPLLGHSGVQGGVEMGCVPQVERAQAELWDEVWAFPPPRSMGMTASEMIEAAALGEIDAFWIVGGNFLETLGDETQSREALQRPRLRIHHDIMLSSAMLVDPSDTVLVLPAATRYESPGGGTETTSERRVVFSPEIPGRRVGAARPEWWVFGEVMARVRPEMAELIRFWNAVTIRREIAAAVPRYERIETLRVKGDEFQWGGRTLFAGGAFETPTGRAHFAPADLKTRARRPAHLFVSTRRGRQFNSMVYQEVDALTGARREDVLMSAEDARDHGLEDGTPIRLVSAHGTFEGFVKVSAILPGNLEVHWPEGNALLPGNVVDPSSLEPDYNTQVRIERLSA